MVKSFSALIRKFPMATRGTMMTAQPKLKTFVKHAKVELMSSRFLKMPKVITSFSTLVRGLKNETWKKIAGRSAWLNVLIGMEFVLCIFASEYIEKSKRDMREKHFTYGCFRRVQ